MELIDKLETIRQEKGQSDEAFARSLGISRSMWIATRGGKYPIRFEVLAGAIQEFAKREPSIIEEVVDFLRDAPRKSSKRR